MKLLQTVLKTICLLLILAVAMLPAGCGSGSEKPSDSGDSLYRILFRSAMDAPTDDPDFQSNPQKYFELYTMQEDGSDIRRITDNLYWEVQPDVSPDGQRIVCSIHYSSGHVQEIDAGWEIAVMDIDGKNLTRLTDNDYLDYGAHWNYDGTKIVYISDSARRSAHDLENSMVPQLDIYTMNADGTGRKQITESKPGDVNADPSFSFTEPSKILYIHSEVLSSSFDLYMMDADGSNNELILEHNDELLKINDPMFSPDGSKIIFEAKMRDTEPQGNPIYNLFTVDSTGGDLKRITQDDRESDILPQYSPDGTQICYFTYVWENGGNTHRIRVANADGSDERVLSEYPWEADPTWIP